MPSEEGYAQLKKDEGFTPTASHHMLQSGKREKIRTLGYGYNIDAAANPTQDLINSGVPEGKVQGILEGKEEISKEQADALLHISLLRAGRDAAAVIPNFDTLEKPAQDVLINMAYQLGREGLRGFSQMRKALLTKDYQLAAKHLLNSELAREQSTERAERHAKTLRELKTPTPEELPNYSSQDIYDQIKRGEAKQRLEKVLTRMNLKQRLAKAMTKVAPEDTGEADQQDKTGE